VFYRADPWLHVIAGCMSSGKSDELFRLLRRAEIARRRVLLVRPDIDTRTPPEFAESRSKARYPSRVVPTSDPWLILSLARESDADLVGIDEAEFFAAEIVDVVEAIRRSGRHVIVTGLNLDFAGRPFGAMPELLARADDVTMLTAICVICGETATRTQRLVNGRPAALDDPLVVIGGLDDRAIETYEARCNRHHEVGPPSGRLPEDRPAAEQPRERATATSGRGVPGGPDGPPA
jgi:thymidine kinase